MERADVDLPVAGDVVVNLFERAGVHARLVCVDLRTAQERVGDITLGRVGEPLERVVDMELAPGKIAPSERLMVLPPLKQPHSTTTPSVSSGMPRKAEIIVRCS